jgi:hypothetical protein
VTLAVPLEANIVMSGYLRGRGKAACGEASDTRDDRLAGSIGVYPGGLRDGLGHAVLANPELSADRSWRDGVDADAARPELLGQRLGEGDQRSLWPPRSRSCRHQADGTR